ncbi:ABC transporter ATP-binding protein [Rhodococcus sp. WAY2]|uniref:ABC transporter ATP-binding protein n=1 Tax=Rhodococcus sp. WAY2 TaxID=2663121 RepID=UPI00131FA9BF|nr:oligopeptide/dipeptide ABC transporter ATP-binding protein [Rhodococcus sp. WAY2]QHE73306.1 Oligopeptide transport ATP-binding protein OppF [Rhodococcus sp. WAY2]
MTATDRAVTAEDAAPGMDLAPGRTESDDQEARVVLGVEGIEKSYVTSRNLLGRATGRFHAVQDVDLVVRRGETVAVVGESGAGKSTLGRIALRLIDPDKGRVVFDDIDLTECSRKELRSLRARMRMIFQDPYSSLDPTMTVGDAVAEPLLVHTDLSRDERRERVLELVRRVGMDVHHLDRYPYEFSGGQLQRIAIARAIATGPDLIVCDEPVAALDTSIRAQVVNLLADLQEERGVAYLFITHDLSLVRLIADRVVVMYRGRVVEAAPTAELFECPRHPYTRALLAAVPTPDTSRRRARSSPLPLSNQEVGTSGCAFASRCAHREDRCTQVVPELVPDGRHEVRCLLGGNRGLAELPATVPLGEPMTASQV